MMAATYVIRTEDDDCFDDSKDMHTVNEVAWNKLLTARMKDGFADGKYLGEESTVQSGFNQGYVEGFELQFPFSIIKGLLAVNKMHLSEMNPSLLDRSMKIKTSLLEFEQKISNFKLRCLQTSAESDDEFLNKNDENYNSPCEFTSLQAPKTFSYTCAKSNEKDCLESDSGCYIIKEYDCLKHEVVNFLRECNQPMLLKKIEDLFERWNLKDIIQHNLYKDQYPKCSQSSCSTKAS